MSESNDRTFEPASAVWCATGGAMLFFAGVLFTIGATQSVASAVVGGSFLITGVALWILRVVIMMNERIKKLLDKRD